MHEFKVGDLVRCKLDGRMARIVKIKGTANPVAVCRPVEDAGPDEWQGGHVVLTDLEPLR